MTRDTLECACTVPSNRKSRLVKTHRRTHTCARGLFLLFVSLHDDSALPPGLFFPPLGRTRRRARLLRVSFNARSHGLWNLVHRMHRGSHNRTSSRMIPRDNARVQRLRSTGLASFRHRRLCFLREADVVILSLRDPRIIVQALDESLHHICEQCL